jgi:hypothetical protein
MSSPTASWHWTFCVEGKLIFPVFNFLILDSASSGGISQWEILGLAVVAVNSGLSSGVRIWF